MESEQDWHAGAAPAAVGLAGRQNACGRCHEKASVWARTEGPAQPGPRLTTWPSRGLAWPLTSEAPLAASAQVGLGGLSLQCWGIFLHFSFERRPRCSGLPAQNQVLSQVPAPGRWNHPAEGGAGGGHRSQEQASSVASGPPALMPRYAWTDSRGLGVGAGREAAMLFPGWKPLSHLLVLGKPILLCKLPAPTMEVPRSLPLRLK